MIARLIIALAYCASSACASGPGSGSIAPELDMPPTIAQTLAQASREFRVPVSIALPLAVAESGLDETAISPKGARGLMQILERYEAWLACHYGIADFRWDSPRDSARLGCAYLADLRSRFGSWPLAVMAYNMGPTALERGDQIPSETVDFLLKVIEGPKVERLIIRILNART